MDDMAVVDETLFNLAKLLSFIQATPLGDPELPSLLEDLAELYAEIYESYSERNASFLNLSIIYARAALACTALHSSEHPSRQIVLASCQLQKYRHSGDLDNLDEAIQLAQQAVGVTPLGDPDLPYRLRCLAFFYGDRFDNLANGDDVEAALRCCMGVIEATPSEHPDLISSQTVLGIAYSNRYTLYGDEIDFNGAVTSFNSALCNTPLGSLPLSEMLRHLGSVYLERYRISSGIGYARIALRFTTAAVESMPLNDEILQSLFDTLSKTYSELYDTLRATRHPLHLIHQTTAVTAHVSNQQPISDINDLDLAIKWSLASLERTPPNHPFLADREANLCMLYQEHFVHSGKLLDLKMSLKYGRGAVDHSPADHPNLHSMVNALALASFQYFRTAKDIRHLNDALKYNKVAIDITPFDHPSLSDRQDNLVVMHLELYQRSGDLEQLEYALTRANDYAQKSHLDHPNQTRRQYILAGAYTERYRRFGDLEDLEIVITVLENAIKQSGSQHVHAGIPHHLSHSLGIAYEHRYDRLGQTADLDRAIKHKELTLKRGSSTDTLSFPDLERSLATSYRARFRAFGNPEDLAVAETHAQAALNAAREQGRSLVEFSEELAGIYLERFRHHLEQKDLELALQLYGDVVSATPADDPQLSKRQGFLALCYEGRFEVFDQADALESALTYSRLAMRSKSAYPSTLWIQATVWGRLAMRNGLPEAVEAFTAAFAILPDLVWLGNSLRSRHDALKQHQITDATSRAVAAALEHSTLQKAVEFFEAGQSVMHKQSFQLRRADMLIWDKLPAEAKELRNVSFQLQLASESSLLYETDMARKMDRHQLSLKRKRLIEDIRSKEGFERFLMPASWAAFEKVAEDGPVILLNASQHHSDAILLLPDASPRRVLLRGATAKKLQKALDDLKHALAQCRIASRNASQGDEAIYRHIQVADFASSDQTFKDVLGWLWSEVVEPILNCLHTLGIADGRIWWCPSGLFTYLPLHAAAIENESRFIQSYTFTLESLLQAKRRSHKDKSESPQHENILLAGVSDAPHLRRLPFVSKEVRALEELLQNSGMCQVETFTDSRATLSNITQRLSGSSWLHFACHGKQEADDPLTSGLELFDGRLQLRQILEANLVDTAKFIYLSACETAMGDAQLDNEAMHLVGGFMAAGFRSAVGTLWSMADNYGPQVALNVYRKVLQRDSGHSVQQPRLDLAAEGLSDAIHEIRHRGARYHQWMPFIHVGI